MKSKSGLKKKNRVGVNIAVPGNKKRVLFICTHNAARSQMAEGLLRALHGELYEVFSAGTEPAGVSPYAVKVMSEMHPARGGFHGFLLSSLRCYRGHR